jgi:hypothetical protein
MRGREDGRRSATRSLAIRDGMLVRCGNDGDLRGFEIAVTIVDAEEIPVYSKSFHGHFVSK